MSGATAPGPESPTALPIEKLIGASSLGTPDAVAMRERTTSERARQIVERANGGPCCDLHNQHCEPPSELCCWLCTEGAHDTFPIRHSDGSRCVLEDWRDASAGLEGT